MISGKQIKPGTVSWVALNEDVLTAPHITTALANTAQDLAVNNQKITQVATPTNSSDAATKGYVDSTAQGLDVKESVRALSTDNVDEVAGGEITVDGVNLVSGDRVLLVGQTNAAKNGIWVVSTGAWSRPADAGVGEITSGMFTFVEEGLTNANAGWVCTTPNPITVGTTSLSFSQFSGAGQIIPGAGLSKSGNTLNLDQINDDQHGSRSGGSLHALATQTTAGFMSAADKLVVDSISTTVSNSNSNLQALIAQETQDREDAIAAEQTARQNADNIEATARTNSVALLTQSIASEATDRQSADADLTSALAAEASARLAADTAATDALNQFKSDSNTALSAEASTRASADSAEATTRAAADQALTDALAAEASARVAGDAAASTALNQFKSDSNDALAAEATTRATADSAESAARSAADQALTDALTAEASARLAADTAATAALNQFKSDSNDALAAEAGTRADADTLLTTNLALEAQARANGDTTEMNARIQAISDLTDALAAQKLYPRATNRAMAAMNTAGEGDGALACSQPLAVAPVLGGFVEVSINGVQATVGNGSTTGCACYFSGDDGAHAKTFATLASGDLLYWNASVANYDLATDDLVSFAVFA